MINPLFPIHLTKVVFCKKNKDFVMLSTSLPLNFSLSNHHMSKLLFVLSLSCFLYRVAAQAHYPQFDYLTITEGLPHNTVYCLTQDKHGFIWAGTQDGLVRYDGYECRVFKQKSNENDGFEGKSIHCILEDKQGNLWVGTQTCGLNFRESKTGQFKNLSHNPLFKPLAKAWIKHIFQDREGRVWIGTIGMGLWCFEAHTQKLKHFDKQNSALKDNAISSIAQDENGRIWVAASGKGIYYFDDRQAVFNQIHATGIGETDFDSYRKTFYADKKGSLWVGTEGSGLYQIHLSDGQIRRFTLQQGLSSNNIMGIAENDKGELLLATDGGGLNIFDPQRQTFSAILYGKTEGKLNTNALYNVLIDHDKNLWIGTYNGGINIFKTHKTHFETFTWTGNKAGELSHRSVLSICETNSGQIFVGTDGGGLNLFNKKTKTFSLIPNQPIGYGNVVKSIFCPKGSYGEDRQKRLWLGYFGDGLSLFDPHARRFRHFRTKPNDPLSIGGNNVWSITEDKKGQVWVGILGGGLSRLDDEATGRFQRFNFNPNDPLSISSDDVMVVFADKDDQVWVGTNTEGLNLLDRQTGKFTRFQHKSDDSNSLSANDIRCIFQDTKGRLWIGTESGGLNLWLGKGQFTHFTVQNGLISNAIMSIQEDKNGYLWLSTFKGISRFELENKQSLNFDFNKNPYLKANQFNQASSTKYTEGGFFFGGINGLTLIQPEHMPFLTTSPRLVFTDFKVFNQTIPIGKMADGRLILDKNLEETTEIHLSYRDNVFSIEFAALDFTDPFKNQYAYKMEGFDENWRTTDGTQRLITYTNLDPDTYTFKVKGANNNGVWSAEKTLKIIISPPFWRTWWFKLLMFISILALSWLALRIYTTRREMALNQQVLESDRAILTLRNENLAAEQAILHLQNEKLASEIEAKNADLMSKAVQMAHKNEILISLQEQLDLIRKASEVEKAQLLRGLKTTLETEIESERSWEQFTLYFDQVNQNFTAELLKKHNALTQNDLRMCALTRLNMSNKEMAALLNISVTGVEKSRYRLKKRLGLTTEDDLGDYLRAF
jgi:ligand-binding sensor domain-containing protein/DNA-binding CsgD family transcriptional regulator